jgi:actin-like ATPase involved in cell morphogenesis
VARRRVRELNTSWFQLVAAGQVSCDTEVAVLSLGGIVYSRSVRVDR